jgi:alkanesulfonate monooxygenase SsuD/methylene tetrahydromethanopterin reductase-like flavin-dependent oxidoreductase (luciferase family)
MKFFFFNLATYTDIDYAEAKQHRAIWTFYPNKNFVPEKGRKVYEDYLDAFEAADRLGFDGVTLTEHHQTAHSMMPSPMVMAAAVSQRTKNAKIAILGRALPLYPNPVNVAEEFSMLDHLSNGRMIAGFVRGNGPEYLNSMTNPAESLGRFQEAHDLIKFAWTTDGPASFEGRYFNFPYVNLWPKPLQQPHIPIWFPSTGSSETIKFAARKDRRYTFLQVFSAAASVERNFNLYREAGAAEGYEVVPDQLGWSVPTYVAETDEIARAEARLHMERLFNVFLRMAPNLLSPPGFSSVESYKRAMKAKKEMVGKDRTLEDLMEQDVVLVGSPKTVKDKIAYYEKRLGFGWLNVVLQFGSLPHELTMKNLNLFATEVMGPLRRGE